MSAILQVAIGGAIGAVLRYLVVLQAGAILGPAFPFGTMIVNLAGSFVMGVAAGLIGPGSAFAPFLMAGILGGFTTFSAFSLDFVALIERGQTMGAFIYACGSVAGAIAALFAGILVIRGWPA